MTIRSKTFRVAAAALLCLGLAACGGGGGGIGIVGGAGAGAGSGSGGGERAPQQTLTISATQPFANGASFGAVGAYDQITGTIKGEVDPKDPRKNSNWPDYRPDGRPRSATVVIRRNDGGVIGS